MNKKKGKRPIWLIVLLHIFYSWRDRNKYNSESSRKSSGNRHRNLELGKSIGYINLVFNDYLRYSGLKIEDIEGKRIIEVGPGDNFGVALLFLANGAEKVICIDKFYYETKDRDKEREIYKALYRQLDDKQKEKFNNALNLSNGIKFNELKFEYISGTALEESKPMFDNEKFDIVISRAVLEHLYDPEKALMVMDKLLHSQGMMIHLIDFNDHGIFSAKGWNPLTFLTIKNSTYERMKKNSDKPNRKMADFYIKTLKTLDYELKTYVFDIFGVAERLQPAKEVVEFGLDYGKNTLELLDEVKPKLIEEYKNMPDKYLMIGGMILNANKK